MTCCNCCLLNLPQWLLPPRPAARRLLPLPLCLLLPQPLLLLLRRVRSRRLQLPVLRCLLRLRCSSGCRLLLRGHRCQLESGAAKVRRGQPATAGGWRGTGRHAPRSSASCGCERQLAGGHWGLPNSASGASGWLGSGFHPPNRCLLQPVQGSQAGGVGCVGPAGCNQWRQGAQAWWAGSLETQ